MKRILTYNTKKDLQVKKGDFVVIKKGLYKGDIGEVIDVYLDNKKCDIKLIPRIGKYDKSKNNRPPKKLFNPKEYNEGEVYDN